MESLKNQIKELIEEILQETPDVFVVDIVVTNTGGLQISIVLDGDNGIGIDQCVKVSRSLGTVLEEKDLVPEAYNLEVTSPGIDQPLKMLRQFPSRIGRTLELTLTDGSIVTGKLDAIHTETLDILTEIKEKGKKITHQKVEVPINSLHKTMVLISFK